MTKWKDKRDVLIIRNKHSMEMVNVTNWRGESKSNQMSAEIITMEYLELIKQIK